MRNAQRFPVRIKMAGYEIGSEKTDIHRFFNGQGDVIIYTSKNWLMNTLGAASDSLERLAVLCLLMQHPARLRQDPICEEFRLPCSTTSQSGVRMTDVRSGSG